MDQPVRCRPTEVVSTIVLKMPQLVDVGLMVSVRTVHVGAWLRRRRGSGRLGVMADSPLVDTVQPGYSTVRSGEL